MTTGQNGNSITKTNILFLKSIIITVSRRYADILANSFLNCEWNQRFVFYKYTYEESSLFVQLHLVTSRPCLIFSVILKKLNGNKYLCIDVDKTKPPNSRIVYQQRNRLDEFVSSIVKYIPCTYFVHRRAQA